MGKLFLSFFLFLILGSGVFITKILPSIFHKQVHKEWAPQILEKATKHTILSSESQQSVFETSNWTKTITSVAGLNPLDYHIIIRLQNLETNEKYGAQVSARFTPTIALVIHFDDFTKKNENSEITITDPMLIFTTPYDWKLISPKTRLTHILSNLTSEISAKKINVVTNLNEQNKNINSLLDEIKGSLKLETNGNTKQLKTTAQFRLKNITQSGLEMNTNAKDAESHLTVNSINLDGIIALYKKYQEQQTASQAMPAMFLMMGLMEDIKKSINYPFNISYQFNMITTDGPVQLEVNVNVEDLEKNDITTALTAKAMCKIPKMMVMPHISEYLAQQIANQLKDQYYMIGQSHPGNVPNLMEKIKIQSEIKEKLAATIKEFLETVVEGEKRNLQVLETALQNGYIQEENGIIVINFEFSSFKLLVNGHEPSVKIMEIVPMQEILTYLHTRGFIPVKG